MPKTPKTSVTPRSFLMLYEVVQYKRPIPEDLLAIQVFGKATPANVAKLHKLAASLNGCFTQDSRKCWEPTNYGYNCSDKLAILKGGWYPRPKRGSFDRGTFGAAVAARYLEVNGQGDIKQMAEEFGVSTTFWKRAMKQLTARGGARRHGDTLFTKAGRGGTNFIMLTPCQRIALQALWHAMNAGSTSITAPELEAKDGKYSAHTYASALAALTAFGYATRRRRGQYSLTAKGKERALRLIKGTDLVVEPVKDDANAPDDFGIEDGIAEKPTFTPTNVGAAEMTVNTTPGVDAVVDDFKATLMPAAQQTSDLVAALQKELKAERELHRKTQQQLQAALAQIGAMVLAHGAVK